MTASISILHVSDTLRRAGIHAEPFVEFLAPLFEAVIPLEEQDVRAALRLCGGLPEISLHCAAEASVARHRGLRFLTTLETFDQVPGLVRVAL